MSITSVVERVTRRDLVGLGLPARIESDEGYAAFVTRFMGENACREAHGAGISQDF